MEQISSLLRRAIADELSRGLSDPRYRGLVTVTAVKVSGDMKHATVSVTVMPEEHEGLTMHALSHAAGNVRRRVMEKVTLREMPQLRFIVDEGLKHQHRVTALLAQARQAEGGGGQEQDPRAGGEASADAGPDEVPGERAGSAGERP
jgi:ribosome-binding factor A